jgi:hypothetical protein
MRFTRIDLGEITPEDMSNLYPFIWQKFISDSSESDDIKVIVTSGEMKKTLVFCTVYNMPTFFSKSNKSGL